MLRNYFYHEIIKKTVIGFGTLFNEIHIRHSNSSGDGISDIKVPLAYGPMQKFLARLEQQPELNQPVQIVLPRMSFEMTSIRYDSGRKTGITQTFKASDSSDNDKIKKVYMPVPYNIGFELNILTKFNDEVLQIVEQILPFFQPSFTVTVDMTDVINEKKDVPIVLDSVSFRDDYEGDFSTRRLILYTLQFTAKTYMFGPISDSTDSLIRKVQVDMYAGTDTTTAKREMRYTVQPDPVDAAPDDNWSFDEDWQYLGDAKAYSPVQQSDV